MAKQKFKPGNMLYPLPVVMVSVADKAGNKNIVTVAWAGTICSSPPMVSISVRPERYSHHMIMETGEFVINLTTKELAFATDYCGVKSGRDIDKFKEMKLTPVAGDVVSAPLILESPVNIECKVTEVKSLGTHDMFMAEVVAVHADEKYMDEKNRFDLTKAEPIVYSHGAYLTTGKEIGTFGYSVRKNKPKPNKSKSRAGKNVPAKTKKKPKKRES
ncbi:MAG: flavin reductase family protein [Lachnospiraceae bacterium]|nr:flavin reductase family protein [Lachnospiraceae bacterium]